MKLSPISNQLKAALTELNQFLEGKGLEVELRVENLTPIMEVSMNGEFVDITDLDMIPETSYKTGERVSWRTMQSFMKEFDKQVEIVRNS